MDSGSVIEMGLILEKKQNSAELQQILHMQRSKLEQVHSKLAERMEQGRQEAKEALARGDESGFRIASRKYSLSKSTASSINSLKDMAIEMNDLVEIGGDLSSVIGAGGDLAKIQNQLGLDPTKLQSSMARISVSMTRMEDVSNVLSSTIESSVSNPKQLSTDQESLRKELLAEMSAERTGAEIERVKEQVNKELQKT
jgi:hypothetical protein